MGQRAWSVREKETYALVSCLLKFKSWISGRHITVFTDHKSLESWYKEELCTMAGPFGRRGPRHKLVSRYNIVVVYKPGVENDAADGMSRWAYPAVLAHDTNFHGSDADLEGVTQWEASEREKEQQLIAANQYPRKVLEVRAPKGRPSPQDMQDQQERDHLLLQVNRLHNSVYYDTGRTHTTTTPNHALAWAPAHGPAPAAAHTPSTNITHPPHHEAAPQHAHDDPMALDIDSLLELELQHTEDTEQHMDLTPPEPEPATSDSADPGQPGPQNAPLRPPTRERAPWTHLSNALRRLHPTHEASKGPAEPGRLSSATCPTSRGRGSTGTPTPPHLRAAPHKNGRKSTPSTSLT